MVNGFSKDECECLGQILSGAVIGVNCERTLMSARCRHNLLLRSQKSHRIKTTGGDLVAIVQTF